MPRTRSLAWSELRIGVVTIAAIAITAMTVFLLTGDAGFSWQQYSLKTRFPNVAGLKSGSPVRLAGLEVGTVREVTLAGEEVEVTFTVREDYQPQITTDSEARLGSVSLLGEAAVDISPAASGTPVPEWGYVRPGRTAAQLADITDQAAQGIDQLTGLLTDIRGGRGTVGKLMTDDQLYAELRRFVSTAGDLAQGIREGDGTLGRLVNDPATAQALEGTLANLETITRQINAGEGSLGRLLRDDAFSRNLTSATANIDTLMARVNAGEGTAGRLINDPALYNRLNAMTERIDVLIARLNDGEGTAGQLLKDRQLYENMNKVTADMSALIADIRKDPRRFFPEDINISIW